MTRTPDLLSLVLSLRPVHALQSTPEKPLPVWWARAAYSLLLKVVSQSNERLAVELHDPDAGLRPFTTSTLWGYSTRKGLDPQHTFELRLTAIQDNLVAILLNAIDAGGLLAPGALVELDYHPFRIEAVRTDASEHPWAALTGYQELSAPYLLGQVIAPRQVTLQLNSPTTFKSGGMHVPYPLGGLACNSLLERWNSYAPVVFPPEVRTYAEECLAVSHYELSSRSAPTKGRGLRVGAVGTVTFTTLNYDRYWMSVIATLARFSLFAGIGAGTTMGMGQSRMLDNRPTRSGTKNEPVDIESNA